MDSMSLGLSLNFLMLVVLLSPLNALGAVLAFLGIRKNEPMKKYTHLGIVANLPITVASVLLFVVFLACYLN